MNETFDHQTGAEFKSVPEIYQIELTNACNLKCPMCLRTTDMVRPDQLLKFDLLKKMHQRGDFAGSFYVELQMAGEPTLHPELKEIVEFLKLDVGVMVGCSTHGLQIKKNPKVLEALMMMDAVTISVDSVDPVVYHKMRYPAKIEQLLANLEVLFAALKKADTRPFVELQLVKTALVEGSGDVKALTELMTQNRWTPYAQVRTTADCFSEMQGRLPPGINERNTKMCMNPFMSVSVAQNGDVVSCCFIFDPKRDEMNWYGNLNDNSLAEIWNSPRVRDMRQMHIDNAHNSEQYKLEHQCAKCYLKSPVNIHLNIVSRLVRLGG